MYLGRIVEEAARDVLYRTPLHPYTQSLLSAVPVPDPASRAHRARIALVGEVASPSRPPSGCAFHPRCPRASDICRRERPVLTPHTDQPRRVACHHPGQALAQAS
jgi:peptide/nickel transport system ATP-binding protein